MPQVDSATRLVQVANSRSTKAENTTLQSELSALREQLSSSTRQLEAEQATSEASVLPLCRDAAINLAMSDQLSRQCLRF